MPTALLEFTFKEGIVPCQATREQFLISYKKSFDIEEDELKELSIFLSNTGIKYVKDMLNNEGHSTMADILASQVRSTRHIGEESFR